MGLSSIYEHIIYMSTYVYMSTHIQNVYTHEQIAFKIIAHKKKCMYPLNGSFGGPRMVL